MKIAAVLLGLVSLQDRVSPDLLDYQPTGSFSGTLELGPANGFETLLTRWADRMKQHYPDLRGGKTEGTPLSTPAALIAGSSRLGILARRWTDSELDDYRQRWDCQPYEIVVGGDALAIVVHPENPIRSLLLEQIDGVFSSTLRRGGRSVRTWGDLGLDGEWKQRPINPYSSGKETPARRQFQERALKGGQFREGVKEVSGSAALLQVVSEDPCGIGYLGGDLRPESIRVVPLQPSAGAPGVEPQPDSILSLSYPLAWRIYMNVRKTARGPIDPELMEFLKMILSRDGQAILAGEGFAPVTGRFARRELLKLR
jgi:phosphate transport system substrate-binding protein